MADPQRPGAPPSDLPVTFEEMTAGDGYRWFYRRYRPARVPIAHVVGIHGIQSHGGWYEHSCGRLCQAGFDVSFLDRRGSGLNHKDRGDAPSFRQLLDDLAEFLLALRLYPGGLSREERSASDSDQFSGGFPVRPFRVPSIPVFLVAISWGGKLAVALQKRHPGLVDGLALLCPGFFPRVGPSLWQRLAILATRPVRPRRPFPIPLNDPQLFTTTPQWQHFIRDDPLGLRQASARLLFESARLDGYLRLVPPYVQVPVLLMLAELDRIIYNDRTRQYVDRFATTDKQIIEYPGAHHTLEFEPDPEPFLNDLKRWLEQKATEINPS